MRLFGLVLSGGKSSRMGFDKGLIMKDGLSFALHSKNLLNNFCEKTFISINATQLNSYLEFFDVENFIVDNRDYIDLGPISGLYTSFDQFPEANWLVVSSDMQNLDNEILQNLVLDYSRNKKTVCYKSDFIIPLPSIISGADIQLCKFKFPSSNIGLKRIFELENARFLSIEIMQRNKLKSYNIPSDLA